MKGYVVIHDVHRDHVIPDAWPVDTTSLAADPAAATKAVWWQVNQQPCHSTAREEHGS